MAKIHFDITGDNSNLVSSINDTTSRLESLSSMMKDIGKGGEFDMSDAEHQLDSLQKVIKQNEDVIRDYEKQIQDLTEAQKEAALAGDTDKVQEYGEQLSVLANRMQETVNETNQMKAAYNELSGSMNQNEGIMMKLLGGQENFNKILSQLPPGLRNVVTGLNGMTGAAKAFIATPLGAVLAALILAYQALSTWLHKTAEGQQTLAKITGYLSGAMAALENIVKRAGKELYDAFKNPKQAAADFLKFLKDQVINRVEALGGIFVNLGDIIKNVFTGDFDAVKEAFGTLGKNAVQFATGLDADALKKELNDINEIAKAEAALNVRRNKLHRERSQWEIEEAELREKLAQEQNKMYTGSAAERSVASARAEAIINKIYNKRIALAQEEYDIKKASNALTESSQEELDEENHLLAQITNERRARISELRMFQRRGHTAEQSEIQAAIRQESELNDVLWDNEERRISLIRDAGEREAAEIELRYKKRKAAIEKMRKQWAQENKQATGFEGLTEEQRKALDRADELNEQEHQQGHLNALLEQYKTYQQRRKEIEETGEREIRELIASGHKEEAEERRKAMDKELKAIDRQYSNLYKQLAKDRSRMTTGEIADLAAKVAADLMELDPSLESNLEEIQRLRSELESLRGELLKKFTPTGLLAALIKPKEDGGDYPLIERLKDIGKAWTQLNIDQKFSVAGAGAASIADHLGKAVENMRKLAEISGDTELADTAEALGRMARNLGAAAQGAQSGSWVGAIVAGALDIFSQITEAITEADLKTEIAIRDAKNYADAIKLVSMAVKDGDFDTIFGQKSIERASAYYKSAQDNLEEYRKKVKEITGAISREDLKQLAALGAAPLVNSFFANPLNYDENGMLDLEKARAFLETNTQLTEVQRQEVENVIALQEAYENALNEVDAQISDTFGDIASDVTDIIWDSVMNGSNAWDAFKERGSEAIASLGKQMIREMLISTYLENYRDELRRAYSSSNPEDANRQMRDVIGNIFGGMEQMLNAGSIVAEEYKTWAKDHGFDLSEVGNMQNEKATNGSFSTMSETTGTALEGRFTAFQISNQMIADTARSGLEKLITIADIVVGSNGMIEEIKTMHLIEIENLQSIKDNTKPLLELNERLDRIERKM